jgi:hypothetical protein
MGDGAICASAHGARVVRADYREGMAGRNLSGQNLAGANLVGEDLIDADLSGADLSGADLTGANLARANVKDANLERTRIDLMFASSLRGYRGTPDWQAPGAPSPRYDSRNARFSAAGRTVVCAHCGSEVFHMRKLLLDGRVGTFFGFEWLSPTATAMECATCGYLHWFTRAPDQLAAIP